jgi:hypothetical protein
MRGKSVSLWIVMMSLVAACQHEHNTITGGYGNSAISGEVVMAEGGSAAGVEVSVPGTGMAIVLGEDGQFAFFDVPEGTDLHFRRVADGIDASLRVDKGASHVVVALTQSNATTTGLSTGSSRRRSAGGGSQSVYEFNGLLKSAGSDRIVVTTERGDVTVGVNAQTVVKKGDHEARLDELVGLRVHVKTHKEGDAYIALLVLAQEETAPPQTRTYQGTVRSASPDRLLIATHDGEVSFALNASTKVTKGDQPATIADLKAGQEVYVGALIASDGTKTATRINIQREQEPPPPVTRTYQGTVKNASSDRLVIGTHDGEVSFLLNASTKVTKGDQPATIADLKAGQEVYVGALVASDGTKTATRINIKPQEDPPPVLKTYEGTVRSVSTDRLVIVTHDGELSFLLNASTKVTKGTDQPATIADLKAGQHVYVGALVASTGAKTAVRVAILPEP